MTEKEKLSINRLEKYCRTEASKDFLIEVLKMGASYLNARSITRYSEDENISYQGAIKRLNENNYISFNGLKIVIDND